MQRRSRLIGSPRSSYASLFPCSRNWFFYPLPFPSLFTRGILTCRPLFLRAPSPTSPRASFDARSPTRVSALLMTPPVCIHRSTCSAHAGLARQSHRRLAQGQSGVAEEFQFFRFGPSAGALSLSTVYSAYGLAGLLHPTAMSRTTPSRGFSLRAAVLSRREDVPPCRSFRARSPVAQLPRAQTSTSRLCSARSSVAPTKR